MREGENGCNNNLDFVLFATFPQGYGVSTAKTSSTSKFSNRLGYSVLSPQGSGPLCQTESAESNNHSLTPSDHRGRMKMVLTKAFQTQPVISIFPLLLMS